MEDNFIMVKVANLEYLVKIYIKNSYNIVKYLFTYATLKKNMMFVIDNMLL